ncbi:MAG: sugar phosphate isomerase/epimerase [Planctomycetota bacterium]|nr:sugar phosphate isomerase/epimerase [Planctomycetota bacterium]
MVRLAFSTNAYTKFSLPEACDRIAAAGYKAIEILADAPHAYPPAYSAHEAARLRERLDALGVSVAAVNGNTAMGYFTPVPKTLTFEPSLISPTGQPLSGEPRELLRERLLEGLDTVVGLADRAGVDLALEPEPGQLLETSAEFKALLDEVGHPRLGANVDVGHVWCAGDDPADSVRLLAPHLKHLHLEDIKGRRHYHLIPGEGGEIDFAGIRRALGEVGYRGAAAVELYTYKDEPDRAAREAYAALAPLFPE